MNTLVVRPVDQNTGDATESSGNVRLSELLSFLFSFSKLTFSLNIFVKCFSGVKTRFNFALNGINSYLLILLYVFVNKTSWGTCR